MPTHAHSQSYSDISFLIPDIDYFFASRLPGEPLPGVEDIYFHPVVARTLRFSLVVGF